MAPRLESLHGEDVARGFRQPEHGDLVTVGVRHQATAVRYRQPCLPQERLVRGLGTDAGGVRRFGCRKGKDRKSTRLNSSHSQISYAVFCLKKKKSNWMTRYITVK